MPKKRKIVTYTIDELSPEARARAIEKFRTHAFDDHDAQMLTKEFETILDERGILNAKANWSLGYSQGDGVCFSGNVDIAAVIEINKLEKFSTLSWLNNEGHISARVRSDDHRYCHWNSMTVDVELTGDAGSLFTKSQREELSDWEFDQAKAYEDYRREWHLVKERNERPIREYERLEKEWLRHGGTGPHDWSPRFRHPGSKPARLTEPYPSEPIVPKPPDLQTALDEAAARWKGIEILTNEFEKWLAEWVKGLSRELEKIGYAEIEYRQSDEAIIEFFNGNEWEFLEDGGRFKA